MVTDIIEAEASVVHKGRGTNPLNAPVLDIAEKLAANPGKWFLIGSGDQKKRSRLSNAAALLSGGRYKQLKEFYAKGEFEARVSGAKNAPHKDDFEVGVFACFVPKS